MIKKPRVTAQRGIELAQWCLPSTLRILTY